MRSIGRDERLERDVAIKVLLEEATNDSDIQRRFAQIRVIEGAGGPRFHGEGDSTWIAYLRSNNGSWALVKASSGGGAQPVVLHDGFLPSHPKWNRKNSHWIACLSGDGLGLISEEGKAIRTLSKDHWLVYGWSNDGTAIYGIKQLADRRRVIASVEMATGAEKILRLRRQDGAAGVQHVPAPDRTLEPHEKAVGRSRRGCLVDETRAPPGIPWSPMSGWAIPSPSTCW